VSPLGLGPGSFTKPNLKNAYTTPPDELPAGPARARRPGSS
jgi:hypothetical protein